MYKRQGVECTLEARDATFGGSKMAERWSFIHKKNGAPVSYTHLVPMLKMRNPNSVKICTILDKPSRRKAAIQPDYEGFQVPDEFVVGYGLDYDEK